MSGSPASGSGGWGRETTRFGSSKRYFVLVPRRRNGGRIIENLVKQRLMKKGREGRSAQHRIVRHRTAPHSIAPKPRVACAGRIL